MHLFTYVCSVAKSLPRFVLEMALVMDEAFTALPMVSLFSFL